MFEATLVVWKFDNLYGAGEAGNILAKLTREEILTIHDAATVYWREGEKRPQLHQMPCTTGTEALGSAFWGMLFGLIFFVPLLGAPLGTAAGKLVISLADLGIDEGFINKVRDHV